MAGYVTINDQKVKIEGEKNLLEMVRKTGIDLPTFCYHSELSVYGACRLCVVETDKGQVISSCSTPPADGIVIKTNTPRLMRIRKMMLELLLANHDRECTSCSKSGKCKLQDLCNRFGIDKIPFPADKEKVEIDRSSISVVRDENKCILCGDCVRTCAEIQGIGAIDFANRSSKTRVMSAFGRGLAETDCINCGQCVAVCPTGALTSPSQVNKIWSKLRDPNMHVIISIAPAVRVAIGEEFGFAPGSIETGRMVAAIKKLGFNEVYDTCYSADITTWEETAEFVKRFTKKENLPHFTSCCPAWVKACETLYPEKIKNLSTCKSPQAMDASLIIHHFVEEMGFDREKIFIVSVMPCVAKKFEAARPELSTYDHQDVDAVITTSELAKMIKSAGIIFDELEEESFDIPYGFATGSAVLYGMTSGVSIAVVREVKYLLAGARTNDVEMTSVEGFPGLKTANIQLPDGSVVRLAVVSGMANVRKVLSAIDSKQLEFDIVEVMACPGGCVGGGGQPIPNENKQRAKRAMGLRVSDSRQQIRVAHDNIMVCELYEKWLKEPNSEIAHEYLHTHYHIRSRETEMVESK
jgi:NADH-quinone oxidoreductase subunit G